jgi:hypothetical protein
MRSLLQRFGWGDQRPSERRSRPPFRSDQCAPPVNDLRVYRRGLPTRRARAHSAAGPCLLPGDRVPSPGQQWERMRLGSCGKWKLSAVTCS